MRNITPPAPPVIDAVIAPPPPRATMPPPRPVTSVPPPPPPPPTPPQVVLELTDMIGDDGKVVSLKEPPRPAPAMSAAPPPPPPPPPQPVASQLPVTTKAMTALQDLQSAARQGAMSDAMLVPVGNLGRAFEDLVREQLKPMLQTWIDQNLPSVIERQVQKEIERISRQASDR
jgi:cell pole-organizing protein PopZ